MQCQKVREWMHARSKANLTDETLIDLQETPDKNFGYGLGAFGNNMPQFIPTCITDEYFDWMQKVVHGDRRLPLLNLSEDEKRAYCCCINMTTGQIYNNDPANNCLFFPDCEKEHWQCSQAYDKTLGKEIYEEGIKRKEAEEKAKAHLSDWAKRPSFILYRKNRATKTFR